MRIPSPGLPCRQESGPIGVLLSQKDQEFGLPQHPGEHIQSPPSALRQRWLECAERPTWQLSVEYFNFSSPSSLKRLTVEVVRPSERRTPVMSPVRPLSRGAGVGAGHLLLQRRVARGCRSVGAVRGARSPRKCVIALPQRRRQRERRLGTVGHFHDMF